jgi:hypothetical protein
MPQFRLAVITVGIEAAVCVASPLLAQRADSSPSSESPPRLRAAAMRVADRIAIDGHLRESAWGRAQVVSQFRQVEPTPGARSAFETTVRILFDADNLYIGVFCRDALGANGIRVQDLRRKFDYFNNDLFGVSIDPLHDGRNAVAFQITPYGSLRELQVFDDNVYNREWEAVWKARTVIADSGWTAEIAVPWASLRYRLDGQPWGINFYRIARRTNETSAWSPWPRAYSAYRMPYAGEIDGLEPPPPRTNVRVRPYVLGQSDRSGPSPREFGDGSAKVGGEVTWAPTSHSALDLTVNTDFAQTEVDRQVINLRRFSVFFPERRQFFLESASLFDVGLDYSQYPIKPFFSRRIGLADDGTPVRIHEGARFVRRDTRGSDGLLLIRQAASAGAGASTFGVARTTRNLGAGGRLGALVTSRIDEPGSAREATRSFVGAVDGFTRIGQTITLDGMVSATSASEGRGVGLGGFASIGRRTNSLYTGLIEGLVTKDYDPSTGFVGRSDVVLTSPSVQYDWRPRWKPRAFRRFYGNLTSDLYHRASDRSLQDSRTEAYVDLLFNSGALVYPDVQHHFLRLTEPFEPVPGVRIPAGRYTNWRAVFYAASDQSAKVGATTTLVTGGYYDRTLDQVRVTMRATPMPQLSVLGNYLWNRFREVGPTVVTHLFTPEIRIAPDPRVQLAAFYQYNSAARQGALNARFSWEFSPLSYVYLVVNDQRAIRMEDIAASPVYPAQRVTLKFTYLLQL